MNITTSIRMNNSIYYPAIPFNPYKCKYVPKSHAPVCGSDGKNYPNKWHLMCAQNREYGIRLNLQLQHYEPCFPWERLGIKISTFLFVS